MPFKAYTMAFKNTHGITLPDLRLDLKKNSSRIESGEIQARQTHEASLKSWYKVKEKTHVVLFDVIYYNLLVLEECQFSNIIRRVIPKD